MPGALIAGDLERIAEYTSNSVDNPTWVMNHFCASDGAVVETQVTVDGEVRRLQFNVPSLTPVQRADGSCVFLGDDNRCTIHPVSPYGCAYHDIHMLAAEALPRSRYAIEQHIRSHNSHDVYSQWCELLTSLHLVAPPLLERRQKMEVLINEYDKRVARSKTSDLK